MPISFNSHWLGLFWAAMAIAIWSGSLVMLRLGVTTSLNAYDLTAIRFGVAALILLPIVWQHAPVLKRVGTVGLLVMVAGFGAPYVLLIALALQSAPASAAGSTNPGVMAITSLFLSRMILRDKVGGVRISGAVLILVGIALFGELTGTFNVGQLILIGTGIMWASYAVVVRWTKIPALSATAAVAVGSAVIYLPVYLLALPKRITGAPLPDILMQAGFQGVLVSVLAIYAFNRSSELLGPLTSVTLPALIPVTTLGLGVIFLDEVVGIEKVVATGLIGAGVALVLAGHSHLYRILVFVRAQVVVRKND